MIEIEFYKGALFIFKPMPIYTKLLVPIISDLIRKPPTFLLSKNKSLTHFIPNYIPYISDTTWVIDMAVTKHAIENTYILILVKIVI